MKCTKCGGELSPMGTAEGVELDFCSGCNGLLFDHGELAEYFELAVDIPDLTTDLKQAKKTDYKCPKCGGPWVEIPYAPQNDLRIYLCTGCGAVWLDKGEFPKLEALAAQMDKPQAKLLRAVKLIEKKGYQVVGVKKV